MTAVCVYTASPLSMALTRMASKRLPCSLSRRDGEVSIADVNYVINLIITGNNNLAGDVNGDGEVSIADVNAVIEIILRG